SSSDSSSIRNLTQLCPWEGGRAISIAQAMYATIVDTSLTPILDNCASPSPYAIRPNNNRPDEDLSVIVAPNPTAGQVTLMADTRITDVYLSNGSRQLLDKKQPNANAIQMDLRDLPEGMYILTVLTDTGASTRRVILVK